MRNVVGVAILVVWSTACPACVRPPPAVPASGERGGAAGGTGGAAGIAGGTDGGGAAGGTGGAASGAGGVGGMPIPEECRSHDVDIAAATLAGALTIGGVPAEPDPNARLLLRNGLNDLVEIPISGASYAVRVAPGSYDVFFSATGPTTTAPLNRLARLRSGVLVAPGDATRLDVDVPATTVAGVVKINGAALAADDTVSLSLRNAAGDTVPIGVNSGGAYSARVVPGTFDLFYTSGDVAAGSATPVNQLARIAGGIVVAPTAANTLDVDVPAATVTGTIAIGGVPAGPTNRGKVTLRSAAGDVVRLAVANAASYVARVVPGSYDLYFTGTEDAYSVGNQNTRLRAGVVVAAAGTTVLDVRVASAAIEGSLSLDGARPEATDSVHLVLRNAAGDYAQIPWSIDGHYSMHAVPGSYDLYYSKDNTSPAASPANQLARLRAGIQVAADRTTVLDIDVTSSRIMGAVTINGMPAAAGNSGIVTLRSADGDRVTIANTASATYSTRVVAGTYDVYYTRTAGPNNTTTEAPANHAAKLRSGLVVAPGQTTVFDVDIPSATVSGTIKFNGTLSGADDHGTLMLQNAGGDFAPFASTSGGAYTARLVPGSYELFFSNAGSGGDTAPMNTLRRLRCFTVP